MPISGGGAGDVGTDPVSDADVEFEALIARLRPFFLESAKAAVTEAVKRKTGARALRSIFEKAMLNIMFEAPGMADLEEITITDKVVRHEGSPLLKYKSKSGKKSA